MNTEQLSLEHRLLLLRDEIKALEVSGLSPEILQEKLKQLMKERAALEDELINCVVDPANDYHVESWNGLRDGLLKFVLLPASDYTEVG